MKSFHCVLDGAIYARCPWKLLVTFMQLYSNVGKIPINWQFTWSPTMQCKVLQAYSLLVNAMLSSRCMNSKRKIRSSQKNLEQALFITFIKLPINLNVVILVNCRRSTTIAVNSKNSKVHQRLQLIYLFSYITSKRYYALCSFILKN